MNMQTSAATGPSDQTAKVVQHREVMDTFGARFARKYYSVMVIFVWLVSTQEDTCQPPTSIT